jgi:DNA-binding NtrC family response regulator
MQPAIVFFERMGHWAAAWRRFDASKSAREPSGLPPRLIETRSPDECRQVVATHPGSFVVAELEVPLAEATLDLLYDIAVQNPAAAAAVVASRQMLAYEPLARELGALAFAVSPFDLEGLRELAARHLARSTIEAIDVRQRIWENLPWGGK